MPCSAQRARPAAASGHCPGCRPVIPDVDIYRSAAVLIRQHGEGAALEAARRADAMLERGDLEGQAVWKRILWRP